jgi:2-phospho-L-lactate guanylyltransferase
MPSAAAAVVEFAAPRLHLSVLSAVALCAGWIAAIFASEGGRCRDEHIFTETINTMRSPGTDRWRLIIPVKGHLSAKSRLHPPPGVARADLAHAFALDTITAALAGIPPAHLVVVTSDGPTATFVRSQGGVVVPDPGKGLNPAIRTGAQYVERVMGLRPTAVLLGDIAALRTQDLLEALSACTKHPRAMVPDASGIGTVLLTALSPRDLHPRFGPDSAREHSLDSVRLNLDLPALRTDIDDDEALRTAIAIGVGEHTRLVLRPAQNQPTTTMD